MLVITVFDNRHHVCCINVHFFRQTEDEALARALALSLQDSYSNQPNGTIGTDRQQQINEDHLLARALAESERHQRSIASVSSRDRCNVS
jgi:hypothetical protein